MKRVKLGSQARKAFRGRSRGFSLIEVVIAIALIGIIAVAVLSTLSTASIALIIADKRATAESLARSQLEYVKNQPYDDINPPQYILLPEIPAGYEIELLVDPVQTGLQRITAIIKHGDKEVIALEGYKRGQ